MPLGRDLLLLGALLCLGGCNAPLMGPRHMGTEVMTFGASPPPRPAPAGRTVALLAPLTGADADLGPALVNAAKLGLGTGTVPPLAVYDTGSTPAGAALAARQAVAGGVGLILGPLRAEEASAVAPVATAAHVDVLAFTSNSLVSRPGLWPLGITPMQQVAALVHAARADNHGRIAGLLPLTPLGQAMERGLKAMKPSAPIELYTDFASMNVAARVISGYAHRRGVIDTEIKQLEAEHTVAAQQKVVRLLRRPIPPPSFNALLVAETGTGLDELGTLLAYYDISPSSVQILGPALWAATPGSVAAAGFTGALYTAPDPAAAAQFVNRYALVFGAAPPPLADLAFDAGDIARLATQAGGLDQSVLTNPAGFAGADGVLALEPDGTVRRGLAIYRIGAAGAQIVQPAPAALPAPVF